MGTCLVYMTFPSREAALAVARHLIEARLAACANLIPGVTSLYRWEGSIAQDAEVVLIAKTVEERMAALKAAVLARHPTKLPCIVALPLDAERSHAPFLAWIAAETG
jgi:periplasmic divalent cation tolerance protein